jgi:ATP-dependent Clp protease ATP-binding subunit ClpC
MHMLLQILEEGRLTDSLGRHVDFRNTVVILTSNLGFDFNRRGRGLGFASGEARQDYARLKDQLMNEARQVFKPELLNRFDDIIVFRALERDDVVRILDIELRQVTARLEARGISVDLDAEAVDFLVGKGFAPDLGARPLRRAIEQYLEDPLAEAVLREQAVGPARLKAVVQEGQLVFVPQTPDAPVKPPEPPEPPAPPTPPPETPAAAADEAAPSAPPADAAAPRRKPRARKSE